jgi:hypothetical protein
MKQCAALLQSNDVGEARWTLDAPDQGPQLFTGEDGTMWQWNAATAEYTLYDPPTATAKQFTVS